MKLHPLTKPQWAIWTMEQYFAKSVANITSSIMFQKRVDISTFQTALNKTIEYHDSLRIHIEMHNGIPMQYIKPFIQQEFAIIRFDTMDDYNLWIDKLARTPFDLFGDLYKSFIIDVNNQIGVVFHLHHLTADAWTLSLLANTLMRHLKGEAARKNTYLDYASAEKEYEASARFQKDKNFFLSQFKKCSEFVYLSDKKANSIESNRLSFVINSDNSSKIQEFCTENKITPYTLFMNVLAIYVYRIKGAQNLYIGTTVLNRAGRKEKETAGIFVNTVPVLFHVDSTKSSLENLHVNAESISGVFRHQKYQYGDLLKDIREQYDFTDKLYDIMLNYQNSALEHNTMTAQWHFCGCQGESVCIHINDRHHQGTFHLDYDYQTELFSQSDIERMHGHLMNLIFSIIQNPANKPQNLKLLTESEYQKIVCDFNDTAVDYPKDKCIHQLFEEQAERTPDAIAVVFEDKEYTYQQINNMANSLAYILREKGICRNDIVAIIAKRSYKIIVAQFAILKAGGTYLPIDPNYPAERIRFMLDDAQCKAALMLEFAVDFDVSIDMSDDSLFSNDTSNIENINLPEDLCYVIYTSGSTGLPKGVMLPHRSVVNYCSCNDYNLVSNIVTSEMKSILSITTISFDIYVTESLLALLNGKAVIFANDNQTSQQNELNRLALKTNADILQTTPSKLQILMADETQNQYLSNFKVIMLGGESVESRLVERVSKYTKAYIYNVFGPTETTVWSTMIRINPNIDITIGKPIANTQIYILDNFLNLLPVDGVGELYIAGDGVGKGYLNRPELTVEKFIDNPFGNGKMYKTGDLAKWREDGNIEYIGRMDFQVKVRGLRIELGEIENAIGQCDGIEQCAVVVKTNESGHQYICAYYISKTTDVKKIKALITKSLPQYMIPHFFIQMERFPNTPSGKTDRKAFPAPDFSNIQSDAEYVAPVTEEEKIIVTLMEKVLNIQKIGMNDNFFDLGGDSLKAIEFVSKSHHEGIFFTLQDVFDHPFVSLLVEHIADGNRRMVRYQTEDFTEINELLKSNIVSKAAIPAKQAMGDVLITGATGWLGVHILDEFLSRESGTAYCPVRSKSLKESQNRLKEVLKHYFNDKYVDNNRIVVLCGDITEKIDCEQRVDTIIHCAASVKHYGSYHHSYNANVVGTERVLDFAKEKCARLLHISTSSVSGHGFDRSSDLPVTVFDESKLFIGQPLENVYIRSKFEAEAMVLRARSAGLNAAVVRVGNLTNRRFDYKFQHNHNENATLTRLKAFVDLGLYPKEISDFPIEFSPVDLTASAIIKLAQYFDKNYSVFHSYHSMPVKFSEFVKILHLVGIKMEPVTLEDFLQAVYAAGGSPDTSHIHEAFIHDIGADGSLHLQSNIILNSDFSSWYLKRIGFKWSEIGKEYLEGYIRYFRNIKYWGNSDEE